MTILRPPITGDVQLDSWMNEVSNSVGTGAALAGTASSTNLPGAGGTAVNAVTLVLYKRWSANTMPFAQEITVETVYNYSTTTLTNSATGSTANFDGWYRAIPNITDGAFLYAIQVNIADRANLEVISFDNWSPPTLILDSTEAVDGFNTATVNLYKRNTGATPATPQGTLTFTFATSGYVRTVTNDGWTTLAAVGAGDVLWRASAVAKSRTSTDTIPASEWYAAKLTIDGSDGTNGTNGTNGTSGANGPRNAAGYLYYSLTATSAPAIPSASSYNFATGAFAGLTSNWSRTPPEVSGGDADFWATSYYVSEATLGGTQTIVFSTPFSSFSFDGLVTFQNLNNELANPVGSQITTIDGGLLKTGTIDVSQVNISGTTQSNFTMQSAASGSRMKITNDTIEIYSGSTLRVKIGNLS